MVTTLVKFWVTVTLPETTVVLEVTTEVVVTVVNSVAVVVVVVAVPRVTAGDGHYGIK